VNHLVAEVEVICYFFLYKLVVCCCWKNSGLWIDDWVGRMEFTRVKRDKGLIRFDKGKNLGSQYHFRCPCGLGMG
jgi:hypothetical protein